MQDLDYESISQWESIMERRYIFNNLIHVNQLQKVQTKVHPNLILRKLKTQKREKTNL